MPPNPPQRHQLSVLIPAAGAGERLGLGPKAFLPLHGKPMLGWVVDKARQLADEVVIAVAADQMATAAAHWPDCRLVIGGASRQETIARLLEASSREWLVIHDAARPFASLALFRAVIAAAPVTGAAGAFLPLDVPAARLDRRRVAEWFRRDEIGVFQAPQVFSRAVLLGAHQAAAANGWIEQSTMQLVLRTGHPVEAVPGEKTNLKLTTPDDWRLAQLLGDLLP